MRATYSEAMRATYEVDSLIHRTARGYAPKVAEDAASSGCTHGAEFVSHLGPRQRLAYAAVAVAHIVNHATSERRIQPKSAKVRSLRDAAKVARSEGLAEIAAECERIAEMWQSVPEWDTERDHAGFWKLAEDSDRTARYYAEDLNRPEVFAVEAPSVDLLADARSAHALVCVGRDCAICGDSVSDEEHERKLLALGLVRNTIRDEFGHCAECGSVVPLGSECEKPHAEDASILSDGQVRKIAAEWHGGMSSPLYALASSGAILSEVGAEIAEDLRSAQREDDSQQVAALEELARYCGSIGERGPVAGWSAIDFEPFEISN